MNSVEKLGFDNWFWESIPSGKDRIDLSQNPDLKIAGVISVKNEGKKNRKDSYK